MLTNSRNPMAPPSSLSQGGFASTAYGLPSPVNPAGATPYFGVTPGGNGADRAAIASRYLSSRRKRVVDVMLAVLLLALAFPLMLQIAILVKLTSRGPVLFRQVRNGRNGRPFEILKFRTMHCKPELNAAEYVRQASIGDDRITPIGRWLRRFSLDELPQFINVLRGDMSLVGPRPHALCHDRYYGEHIANYVQRFGARPGLTGLAQVNGARGETPTHGDMQRRVDFDLAYTARATLFLDLRIIGKTACKMFLWDEAY